ncbi:MAG: hypothetical protein AUJ72_00335, partial [Candidatus Omnitrophica bacterium CG1_02_46_14]
MKKISAFLFVGYLLSVIPCTPAYTFWFFGEDRQSKPNSGKSLAAIDTQPLTFAEAYRLSLIESEDVATKQSELDKAQGHKYQALNEVMPAVGFKMTESIQDTSKKGEDVGSNSGTTSSLLRRTTPQKQFTLRQPLFSGFKEIAGLQGSDAEKNQKRFEKRRIEEILLTDVASAFYAVIQAEKDVKIVEKTYKTLAERIEELKGRVSIGRSRENEIQTALSDQKKVESQLIIAKSNVITARQELEYYIGREVNGPLADPLESAVDPKALEDYMNKVDSRSDVQAANQAYILAEKSVVVAQSGLFPNAALDGNYYTQRVGIQSGIDWDVLLSVNVPIFNGTETFGEIKVAVSEREMAKYNFMKTKRLARLDIRKTYEEYRSFRLEEAALGEAVKAKKKDYDLQ